MKKTTALISALLASGLLVSTSVAQSPPPDPSGPPPAVNSQPTVTRQGRIKAFNAGPNGETNGYILRDGTTVMLPPQSGTQLRAIAKEGSRITVIGTSGPGVAGQVVVNAQTITVNGQTITVPALAPPPPDPNAPAPPGRRGKAARRGPPPPPPPNGGPPQPDGI